MRYFILAFSLFIVLAQNAVGKTLFIYHDADYTGHRASAESMAMGFNTALSEVNHVVQGYQIKLVKKDHRGNTRRSELHLKQFLKDDGALMLLGGLHSPPYISNREFINQNNILLMVPWAAGGPITRYPDAENWVFRVSIDDTNAGYRLARYAIHQKQCQHPHLLLENTAWGKSNFKNLTKALKQESVADTGVSWFGWGTKDNVANIMLRDIRRAKADCIIFVGNAIEGEVFARTMKDLPPDERLPVISHWGITGGDFHERYSKNLHGFIDLTFIQTCFSFVSSESSPLSDKVLSQAKALYPDKITQPEDIKAPPGFIHAYDLGKILISALSQIELKGVISEDRSALRSSLEALKEPITGLIKTYRQPFQSWSEAQQDAHEALGLSDYCMGYYDEYGNVHLVNNNAHSP